MVRFGCHVRSRSVLEGRLCWNSQKTFQGSKKVRWGWAVSGYEIDDVTEGEIIHVGGQTCRLMPVKIKIKNKKSEI
jgi:hypothetical protein